MLKILLYQKTQNFKFTFDQNAHFVLFCDLFLLQDNSAYGPQKLEATVLSAIAEVIPFIFRTILLGKHFSDADSRMRKWLGESEGYPAHESLKQNLTLGLSESGNCSLSTSALYCPTMKINVLKGFS